MDHKLPPQNFMQFPFAIGSEGAITSDRAEHVREQIQQVLLTVAGERVFRPQFGVGVRHLVFEPNNAALADLTRKRLRSSLNDVLLGEVDPKTMQVDVDQTTGQGETLAITLRYQLSAVGESDSVVVASGGKS